MLPTSELVGYLAASLTTASFVPQAWHTFKTKDVSGISLGMYGAFTAGVALWLVYGLLLAAWLACGAGCSNPEPTPGDAAQAAKADRDRQDCETPAGMERARAAARAMIAEMEQPAPAKHGYGCACHDCGMEREDRKAAATKQPASILDQWEPAPEWAKAAKRVDAQSVNNTTRTGPDGCLPALS